MTDDEILKIIEQGFKKVLGDKVTGISPEQKLIEDIGIDSFASIELIFELEEQFALSIPDGDFIRLVKVQDVVDYLKQRLTADSNQAK